MVTKRSFWISMIISILAIACFIPATNTIVLYCIACSSLLCVATYGMYITIPNVWKQIHESEILYAKVIPDIYGLCSNTENVKWAVKIHGILLFFCLGMKLAYYILTIA